MCAEYDKSVADVAFLRGDYKTAAKMYLTGARAADVGAAFNYGYCLWRGLGTAYDPKEAKSFFVFSRELKGGEACYNLAMLYMRGEGVAKNYKKAFSYMSYSAELGCIEAQLYLGMAYTSGCMFDPDVIGISMIPYHTPEYRDPYSELDGDVPDFERDEIERYGAIKQDANLALYWFRQAAYHSPDYVEPLLAKARFLYAKCFADGLGTDANFRTAARLMFIAADSGSSEAKTFIAENGLVRELSTAAPTQRLGGKK